MKKIFLLLIILYSIIMNLNSQTNISKWNIKVNLTNTGQMISEHHSFFEKIKPTLNYAYYRAEANYRFTYYLESGIYLGIHRYETFIVDTFIRVNSMSRATGILYGINTNLHLLSLLTKEKRTRFDIYVSGKIGGLYLLSPAGYTPNKGNVWMYSINGGIAYYPWKKFGFYGEWGIRSSFNSPIPPIKSGTLGISYRF